MTAKQEVMEVAGEILQWAKNEIPYYEKVKATGMYEEDKNKAEHSITLLNQFIAKINSVVINKYS